MVSFPGLKNKKKRSGNEAIVVLEMFVQAFHSRFCLAVLPKLQAKIWNGKPRFKATCAYSLNILGSFPGLHNVHYLQYI